MTNKVQVSSDTLYQYLQEHNFTISLLGKRMGVSNGIVCNSFQHVLNRLGKPMKFSDANIERINAVLPQIADELRISIITFGSEQVYTSSRGTTYDPSLISEVKQLTKYFKLNAFCKRVLGWNVGKKESVLCQPTSGAYGHITQGDVNLINAELLSVAGVLSSYEVVADQESVAKPQSAEQRNNKKCTRTRMEHTFESRPNPWDNTCLGLLERYRLFHDSYHDGILFFRVNNGYTVCQDDSEYLCYLDSSLVPYAEPSTGLTTTWMDADKFAILMPHCVGAGHRIGVTDMYAR